jgi:enoyl-CoA hydratase
MLDVERRGAVAVIRLGHGPVNALDLEFLQAIAATIGELDADPTVRAMVLTGNGRAFSAGVDLNRILAEGADYTRPFLAALSAGVLAPFRSATPVVAAVDGHAVAGGAVLAAGCDHAVCSDDERVRIGLSELAVGVPFPAAAIELMRHKLGRNLNVAVLMAELHAPSAARDLGFVDELAPADALLDRAVAVATRLAAPPAEVVALVKEELHAPVEDALAAHAADWDGRIDDSWCSESVRGAINDFVDRTLRR